MNPQSVLDRYRDMVVVNSQAVALELSQQMRKHNPAELERSALRDPAAGCVWLFRSPDVPGKVLECVVSPTHGESITAVYLNCSHNGTISQLRTTRLELIEALSKRMGLSTGAIGVRDDARGRLVGLNELTTGQLIDLLAEQMGTAVVVSNSHGVDLDTLKVPA